MSQHGAAEGSVELGGGGKSVPTGTLAMLRLEPSGRNWTAWSMRMRGYLTHQWGAVEPEKEEDGGSSSSITKKVVKKEYVRSEEFVRMSRSAYAVFMTVLDDQQLALVAPPMVAVDDAAALWSTLKNHFERTTIASKTHTRRML